MGSEDSDFILSQLLDDDFFGLPLEPLQDFNVGLEASDLDSLLDQFEAFEQFEQDEKFFQEHFGELDSNAENLLVTSSALSSNNNSVDKVVGHKVVVSTQKSPVSKSKSLLNRNKNGERGTVKRKKGGISLLAKPNNNKVKIIGRQMRPTSPSRFAHYFYQDHDYCPNPLRSLI